VQFSGDRQKLLERARWDVSPAAQANPDARSASLVDALRHAREAGNFRGREAVLALGWRELFVQNIRIARPAGDPGPVIRQEVAERLPFPLDEAELRYLEAGDVRQQETTRREVVVLACHRPVLAGLLAVVEAAGLEPVAVDVEPAALLRCYSAQFRRDEDRLRRAIYVHIGAANTAVVIAQGAEVLFVKYVELGGQHLDDAVARHLQMQPDDAWALRRHNSDRRADQQDQEVARSVMESVRPVIERLAHEISLCIRYYSVTFRGHPLARLVLGGGEATQGLADALSSRLSLEAELGDPLRWYEQGGPGGRKAQWDVATGLALRELN
jgi:type IV pilus assembly protein PilM